MKKSILKISILCFLGTMFIGKSFGQIAQSDSIPVKAIIDKMTLSFYRSIGQESRLYNGHEYLPYEPNVKGTALFPYDEHSWEPGEVNYDGITYKNVPMMYDIYKDALVILLYNKFSMFTLVGNRVRDFSFDNHHFIRIDADLLTDDKAGLVTGFYDQLYSGKIEALVKRSKSIQTSSNATAAPETYFTASNDYYIRKGNTYYKVSGQRSVLNVLKDKKKELQQYIRANHIEFGDDPGEAMAKIAAQYDRVTN